MNKDMTNIIKIEPMIIGQTSTTAPTFGTTSASVSKAVDLSQFAEATFIFSMKENTVTTATATLQIKFQESDVNLTASTNWTDIVQDESTNPVRMFENEATPGDYVVTTTQGSITRYGTMKTSPRKRFIRAVPTASGASAVPSYNVSCILSEPKNNASIQTADFRSAQTDNGIVL